MPETVAERAKRLGLIEGPTETVEARAHRLGLDDSPLSAARTSAKRFATEGTTAHETGLPDETTGDRASGAVSAAYNGLTLGQGNKIIAGLRTIMTAPGVMHLSPEAPVRFSDALREQNAVSDDYARRRPAASAILNVAGSAPTLAVGNEIVGGTLAKIAKSTPVDIARALGGSHAAQARLIGRGAGVLRRLVSEAGTPEATTATHAPSLSGLQEPMETAGELSRLSANDVIPSATGNVIKQLPRQSHRTAASFEDFAQRMGKEPPPSSLDKQLHDLITKARAENPTEVGSTYGDAEEAMGLAPHQQPNLEDLLRRSIARGGTPRP